MKELKNKTLYECEFCKKKYQVSNACQKHELYCPRNPNNNHVCFLGCAYLVSEKKDIIGWDEHVIGKKRSFTCSKKNVALYSYVAERRNLVQTVKEEENLNVIRMPLNCEDYKNGYE